MPGPLVSILVPCYRAARYITPLFASLQRQTVADFEVLFVDDGSPDGSLEEASKFKGDSRFIITGWRQNRGVSAATKFVMQQARGRYWCNPGADDFLCPEFIERRVALLESNPRANLVHGATFLIDEEGSSLPPLPVPNMPASIAAPTALRCLLQHNFINTPSVMMKGEAARRVVDRFSLHWKYAQDWFFWILVASLDGEFLWDPAPQHSYRVHAGSLTFTKEKEASRRAETRLVPLCALASAAELSDSAAGLWDEWKSYLYVMWLRRAWNLKRKQMLDPSWLQLSSQAYYGKTGLRLELSREILGHSFQIVDVSLREWLARRGQKFPVSGTAAIDEAIFKQPPFIPCESRC